MKNALYLVLLSATVFSQWAQAQTCRTDNIQANTPDVRYTDNRDGTVTDKQTGLMWQKCSFGASGDDCKTDRYQSLKWDAALQQVNIVNQDLSLAGYSDWRLPNRKELASLVNYQCYSPAINENLFPNTPQSYFWTSSPMATKPAYSWSVTFRYGNFYQYRRTGRLPIRLVRDVTE